MKKHKIKQMKTKSGVTVYIICERLLLFWYVPLITRSKLGGFFYTPAAAAEYYKKATGHEI